MVTRQEIAELLRQLDDTEFLMFRATDINDEVKRREQEETAVKVKAEMMHELRNSGIIHAPDPMSAWSDPQGEQTKAYLMGDVVTYGDKSFESVFDGLNYDVPGSSSKWSEVVAEE